MKRWHRWTLLAIVVLGLPALVWTQVSTYPRLRLSGRNGTLATVNTSGQLAVTITPPTADAQSSSSDASTFPRVRLSDGTVENLVAVDTNGRLHITCPDCGGSTYLPQSGTSYVVFNTSGAATTLGISSNTQTLAGSAGTLNQLWCEVGTAPGAGNSYAFTVQQNGVDTLIGGAACVISNTNVLCNDTSHSITVIASDLLSIKIVATGTPALTGVSCQISGPGQSTITTNTTTNLTGLLYGNGIDVDAIANVVTGKPLLSTGVSTVPAYGSLTAAYGGKCDYYASPGTNVLQALIDAAADHSTLCLGAGTYVEAAGISLTKDLFLRALSYPAIGASSSTPTDQIVLLDCTGMPNTSGTACIKFSNVAGGGLFGIEVIGTATNTNVDGIFLDSTRWAVLDHVVTREFGRAAIEVGGSTTESHNNTLRNIVVFLAQAQANSIGLAFGIDGNHTENNTVYKYNVAHGTTVAGCAVQFGKSQNNTLFDVTIAGAGSVAAGKICYNYTQGGGTMPSMNEIVAITTDSTEGWAGLINETGSFTGGLNHNIIHHFSINNSGLQSSDPCATTLALQGVRFLDCGGNRLGIGTLAPAYHVDARGNTNGVVRIHLDNASSGASAQAITETLNNAGNGIQIGAPSSGFSGTMPAAGEGYIQMNTGPLLIQALGTNLLRFATNNNERGSITSGGNWIFGKGDATASITGATLRGPNGTGTDKAGVATTVQGSLGTSAGLPGTVVVATGGIATGTGTTAHTAVNRHTFGNVKVLTNNTDTALTNATVASHTVAALGYWYGVEVVDTNNKGQYEVGMLTCGVYNDGTTIAGNVCTKGGTTAQTQTGTLSVTFTITAANPAVVTVNANTSLTASTGYPRITFEQINLSHQAAAVQ